MFEILEKQRSLPHPRLGYQSEEASIRFRAVEERGERLPMLGSEVEEPRVRRHAEGLLDQSVVFKDHPYSPLFCIFGIAARTGIASTFLVSSAVRSVGSM